MRAARDAGIKSACRVSRSHDEALVTQGIVERPTEQIAVAVVGVKGSDNKVVRTALRVAAALVIADDEVAFAVHRAPGVVRAVTDVEVRPGEDDVRPREAVDRVRVHTHIACERGQVRR
ncbi:MAG: hypothetical protein HN400_05685 [Nitrospinaceae bacterium]|nr:hypothetical protein [Nitrospinaceae bacterium]